VVRRLRIVAMGDSLTVGFIPTRLADQPYSRFLGEMIDAYVTRVNPARDFKVCIINRGVNGDLTRDMLLRFQRDVIAEQPHYVILLGGSNDVGLGFPVNEIFSNLQAMYDDARQHAVEPIGCTVPSVLQWDDGIPPRQDLNQFVKCFCHEQDMLCVDLFRGTCDPATNRLTAAYASDGLHFNAVGYRKMAELIFNEAIRDVLTRELR
jgi:acyl-CoA thioesterase-1